MCLQVTRADLKEKVESCLVWRIDGKKSTTKYKGKGQRGYYRLGRRTYVKAETREYTNMFRRQQISLVRRQG